MTKAVTALDDGDLSTLKMQYRRIELTARQALQLCVLAASLGSFCCGMFVGWSSHATVTLSAKYSAEHVARIASYLALGAGVGPLLVQRLWTRIGTKSAVIVSCLVMCTSIIGLFVDYGVVCLLVARFASGLSVGCIQLLMPAYVLDILKCVEAAGRSARMEAPLATTTPAADSTSPMTVFASATFHLQFLLGVLTIFVTGLFDEHLPHLACIVMVAVTVTFTIAACMLPESPRYLCQQQQHPWSQQITRRWRPTNSEDGNSDHAHKEHGIEAARQMLRPFLSLDDDTVLPVGLETDVSAVHVESPIERLLLMWSTEADMTNERGVLALLRGGKDGMMGKRAVFGTVTAVAAAQLMGVTSILFYMEKLLSLSYDDTYAPATNAAVCALCLAAAATLPMLVSLPALRRMLVPATVLCSCGFVLFGFYCHYRGTFGLYDQPSTDARTANADGESYVLPPVLLFGTVLALYALGPMRLCMDGGCCYDGVVGTMSPEPEQAPGADRQALALRSVLLAVGWLCVFGGVRVLPGLVNSVGVGWLLWYMAANGALAAWCLRWWLGGSRRHSDDSSVAMQSSNRDVEKAAIMC